MEKRKKEVLKKHKIIIISILALLLFAGITIYASFAFYKVSEKQTIIGGRVGDLADINLYVMVEDKDANGLKQGTYSRSLYVPQVGYAYNQSKSYCKKGSTITYNNTDYTLTISSSNRDTCYAYFDVTLEANADIVLDIYVKDDNSTTGYRQVNAIPNNRIYGINTTKSSCTNGATMTINDSNKISISASGKTVCTAYLDPRNITYWNDSFGNHVFTYPNTPTTYTTPDEIPEIATNPYYIRTDETSHAACLRYNNKDFCLPWNYGKDMTGDAIKTKLKADMESAFETTATSCSSPYSSAGCYFGSFYCYAYSSGIVYCNDGSSYCYVDSTGNAYCS